ncbi:acetolactate synthase-1/2/3 large subunit [Scopulibacillus daqui]|uniref:Acetolactate synthase-1/2/3 large subunit n=1 Tax=Scopulibacillus daqui TaxID=1469162 RepID=A0ABS2PZ44_9BACL|nr:thiamine pyrophosphate-dependent enzyme [Scopulibacillus daqui]MBM7645218.1 acetolactate synthase-1/2/3 large subunit [Scopulibacillus daqui]
MTEYMTSAEALIRCLEIEDINHVFCVPGESYLPVLDNLYEHPRIKLISGRHEGGVSFMAEGYAKATGKPGIVFATRGVGAGNLTIGVHTAYQDSTPMVVFLGQVHSKFRGREGFQEVDLEQFFAPIAKWTVEIRDAERMPELVQRALRIAQSGRPGPVVVSLPEDVLKEKAEMRFAKKFEKSRPLGDPSLIRKCLSLLKKAERPVILAGGGIKFSDAEAVLAAFSETMDLPVLSSFRRHDVMANDHSHYAGHLGLGPLPCVLETVRQADVILAIGTRLSEVTTQDYSLITSDHKLIHIDISDQVAGRHFPVETSVIADAKMALEQLLEAAKESGCSPQWGNWRKERREAYVRASCLPPDFEEDHDNGCNLKNIFKIIQDSMPEDTVITNDAGNFAGWLHSFYQFKQPKTYIGPTSGAMGYGMPAAIGAKLADPARPVVSLSGDGGFMMTVQELETAARYHIPIIAIVFNNAMYGTIRMHQEKHYPGRVVGTSLGRVNFNKLAEAVHIDSCYVNSTMEFEAVFKQLSNGQIKQPVLIEVMMDPDHISVSQTIDDIRHKAKIKG